MCEAIRQMMDESEQRGKLYGEKIGEERGELRGSTKEKLTIAQRMLEMQCPAEQVVSITRLTREEVEGIRKTIKY